MCAQQSASSRNKGNNNKANNITDEVVDFREVFAKYLYHWPLYVLLMAIFCGVGFFVTKIIKPGYEIKASLVLEDNKADKPSKDNAALEELDLENPPKVVENEIEILKSRNLISKVVYDLKLWVNYSRDTKLVKHEDLYGKSPVDFELLKPQGLLDEHQFEVLIKDKNTFLLKGAGGKLKEFHFSNTLINSFGTWKLVPAGNINKYIGTTINIEISDPNAAANIYQSGISVTLADKEASTVELSYTDQLPQRGRDVLNDLITRYNEAARLEKTNLTQNTLDFIDNRLASLKVELGQAEGQVQNFKSSNGITDLSKQSDNFLSSAQANDRDLQNVNVQLGVIESIEDYLNSPNNANVPSTLGIVDQGLTSLIQKLADLSQERQRILANTPETSPILDPINSQIKSLRSSIKDNISGIKSSLNAQKRKLEGYSNKVTSSIKDVPINDRALVGLERTQTLKENLYTYLLQKKEEIGLSYASTLDNARTVDSAYVVPPKGTKRLIPLAAGLALGLFIPTVIIFGRSTLKNRIISSKEITKAVSIPILAELTLEKSKNPIVVHDKARFALAEEFRTLRTKLHYLHDKKENGRVTLLTSSISSEGKSFVATNLAVALAASGRKTIILEMDLRKPRVSAILDIPQDHAGISNYLNGETGETKIIQKSELYPNLSVMSRGTYDDNPSELLEQPRTEMLISWLRENYDDIIIDTPPVSIVTDAIIVSRLADVTLYVIRQGFTSKAMLPFIGNMEEEEHFPKLNIVFNGIEKGRYGYGGYAGYGYGDYVEDSKAKKRYSKSIFNNFFKRF
jgi:tyrosine-protein kinase Etk/Wzc